MATFYAIPTLAGQAAVLAAMEPGADPIELSQFAVGDGNGAYVTPLETWTQLVNQRAIVPIAAIDREDNVMKIDGIFDETIGGFTIREAGIFDADGILLFVAAVPPTQKTSISEGTEQSLTLGMDILVSDTANITLVIEGTSYATHNYVNEQVANLRTKITTPLRPYFIAVKSLALSAPPDAPTPGDTYIVGSNPTDAWAGQAGKLTQYISGSSWIFVACPNGHVVGDEATGNFYQRIGNVWAVFVPKNTVANKTLWLQDRNGMRSWSNPRDLTPLGVSTLNSTKQIGIWDPTTAVDEKTSIAALAQEFMQSDQIQSELFFWGAVSHG